MSWYLEKYFIWPAGLFRERAQRTEAKLSVWGHALFDATMGKEVAREAVTGWEQ